MNKREHEFKLSGTNQPMATGKKVAIAITVFISCTVLFLGAVSIALHVIYSGRAFPGVSLNGVELGGMDPAEIENALVDVVQFPETGRAVLKTQDQNWVAKPAELGLMFDLQGTESSVFRVGRANILVSIIDPVQALIFGYEVAPVMVFDENIAGDYLKNLAILIDRPTLEADLGINGTQIELINGQVGRSLDSAEAIEGLLPLLTSMHDFSYDLPVIETPPAVMDVREQAALAQKILFEPMKLTLPQVQQDAGPWLISVEDLAKMLVIERVNSGGQAQVELTIDGATLTSYLEGLSTIIDRDVANARFIFNDDTRQLDLVQNAIIGRQLNVPASLAGIIAALEKGEHTYELVVTDDQPQVSDDATAEQLGIHELIWSETSYFRGSSAERIQNIKAAAARFHGLLVPPGSQFSMADALGDISLDNGYAEALIIYGDQTITGIGGGVCQVSTTLFRTAFHSGFPIAERHAHAYRVSYYEQTAGGTNPDLAGLDATVYVPLVDLKFTNDTPYWLLMETYVRGNSLTWKFYSTSDGRTVEWQTSGPQNTVEPPDPLYRENPDLEKGEINQVDWQAEGADVTVTRYVYRGGGIYFQDEFRTHYLPWQAVFEYGPGTEGIPSPEP